MKMMFNAQEGLKQITNSQQFQQLTAKEKKKIINEFKKLHAEQMGKVAAELSRREKVKQHKNQIISKQEKQAKKNLDSLQTRINIHSKKKQLLAKDKINHFKLLDENWQRKIEEIQRKQEQMKREMFQKAKKYRIDSEKCFRTSPNQQKSFPKYKFEKSPRQIEKTIPYIHSQGYFSLKNESFKQNNHYLQKRKSYSKNQLVPKKSALNKTEYQNTALFLPQINRTSQNKTKNMFNKQISVFNSVYQKSQKKLRNSQNAIKEHVEKSKKYQDQKQKLALQKAMEKLYMIEKKRKNCQQNRQKAITQVKLRRKIKQDPKIISERMKQYWTEENLRKNKKLKHTKDDQNISASNKNFFQSRSQKKNNNLNDSIRKHKNIKNQLQQQQFLQRDVELRNNLLKQKRGKVFRMVKQTIKKIKHQTLKQTQK